MRALVRKQWPATLPSMTQLVDVAKSLKTGQRRKAAAAAAAQLACKVTVLELADVHSAEAFLACPEEGGVAANCRIRIVHQCFDHSHHLLSELWRRAIG